MYPKRHSSALLFSAILTVRSIHFLYSKFKDSPWLLEKVEIKELSSFMEYEFRCNKWLGQNNMAETEESDDNEQRGGGQLSIILKPFDPNKGMLRD